MIAKRLMLAELRNHADSQSASFYSFLLSQYGNSSNLWWDKVVLKFSVSEVC